jgi:lipopolysaccharide/colanic/teichoic acid biosynthesis glycosyltransferase
MLLSSALILYKMGNPVFFIQLRPGKNKKTFKIYKFRTMISDSNLTDEERITTFGKFLRKSSIDELPQLFNVLMGDMSLIGPRPLLIEYNDHYSQEQNKRFNIKPGISGLAQVKGRNTLSWDEKFKLDVYYVNNVSFLMDLKIFFKTILVIIGSDGFKNSGEEQTFSESKHDK